MKTAKLVGLLISIASMQYGINSAVAADIDRLILAKLNDGRLGRDPQNMKNRHADRIVSLSVNVIKINSSRQVMFQLIGNQNADEKFFSFENCGSLTETRPYQTTLTKEDSAEVEFTQNIKTSTAFTGKLTTDTKIPWANLGIGTEGTAAWSKDISITDQTKRTSSAKSEQIEKWDFTAPPLTRVIYQVATVNGTKRVEFSGVVVVDGVYHYVIDRVFDANVPLVNALPEEKDRTFPFDGTLTTVKFQEAKFAKYEQKLSAAYCKDKLGNLPSTSIEVTQLPAVEAKKLVGSQAPKEKK